MQAIIFDLDHTVFAAEYAPHDGVTDLLAILKRLGFRIGALTSGDHRMLVRLDETGISRHFDAVLCTDHLDDPKHPDGVRQILAELRTEPHHAVLVSHAHSDIAIGRQVGIAKTIRVTHGRTTPSVAHLGDADHVIDDIPSILDVIHA
ncbi:MAG TPA: HAD family hydrolase [Candidatus Saccharimonadales bacterium]|nr:HAD family hydrolase [Candidatus Saccharimonadales bacterium]